MSKETTAVVWPTTLSCRTLPATFISTFSGIKLKLESFLKVLTDNRQWVLPVSTNALIGIFPMENFASFKVGEAKSILFIDTAFGLTFLPFFGLGGCSIQSKNLL